MVDLIAAGVAYDAFDLDVNYCTSKEHAVFWVGDYKIKLVFVNQVLGAEVIVQVPADEFQGRAQKLIEFTEYPYTTQPIEQSTSMCAACRQAVK